MPGGGAGAAHCRPHFLPFEHFSDFIAESQSVFPELDLYDAYAYDTARGRARLKKSVFLVIVGLASAPAPRRSLRIKSKYAFGVQWRQASPNR